MAGLVGYGLRYGVKVPFMAICWPTKPIFAVNPLKDTRLNVGRIWSGRSRPWSGMASYMGSKGLFLPFLVLQCPFLLFHKSPASLAAVKQILNI